MSDDLDDDDFNLDEESFDDFEEKGQTLGELWKNNSLVKIGVVLAAAIGIFGIIALFGGEKEVISESYVGAGSTVSAPPGTEEASPAYREAVEEETEARIDEAYQTGGSALPTPLNPPVGRLTIPEEEEEQEDPLQRWRQLQEARLQRELRQTEAITPDDDFETNEAETSQALQALSEAMSSQMQQILDSQSSNAVQSLSVTDPNFLDNGEGDDGGGFNNISGNATGSDFGSNFDNDGLDTGDGFFEDESLEDFENVIQPAGQIAYAQLLNEANSDIGGPILAQILSGPLKGSRILGDFTPQGRLLVLNFNTVIIDDISTPMDGVAIDPNTNLTGVATDFNPRLLRRVVFPAAAAFIEGAAQAVADTGRLTLSISDDTVTESVEDANTEQEIASGIEEAGEELGEILDDLSDVQPLIRVRAGTPFGLLFIEPVIEEVL